MMTGLFKKGRGVRSWVKKSVGGMKKIRTREGKREGGRKKTVMSLVYWRSARGSEIFKLNTKKT